MTFKEINRDRYVNCEDVMLMTKLWVTIVDVRAIHVTNFLYVYGGAGHQNLNFVNIRKLLSTFRLQHHCSHIFCHHMTQRKNWLKLGAIINMVFYGDNSTV